MKEQKHKVTKADGPDSAGVQQVVLYSYSSGALQPCTPQTR